MYSIFTLLVKLSASEMNHFEKKLKDDAPLKPNIRQLCGLQRILFIFSLCIAHCH